MDVKGSIAIVSSICHYVSQGEKGGSLTYGGEEENKKPGDTKSTQITKRLVEELNQKESRSFPYGRTQV